jgi:hypothetical protein
MLLHEGDIAFEDTGVLAVEMLSVHLVLFITL